MSRKFPGNWPIILSRTITEIFRTNKRPHDLQNHCRVYLLQDSSVAMDWKQFILSQNYNTLILLIPIHLKPNLQAEKAKTGICLCDCLQGIWRKWVFWTFIGQGSRGMIYIALQLELGGCSLMHEKTHSQTVARFTIPATPISHAQTVSWTILNSSIKEAQVSRHVLGWGNPGLYSEIPEIEGYNQKPRVRNKQTNQKKQ